MKEKRSSIIMHVQMHPQPFRFVNVLVIGGLPVGPVLPSPSCCMVLPLIESKKLKPVNVNSDRATTVGLWGSLARGYGLYGRESGGAKLSLQ